MIEWRCFHCDDVFTDPTAARNHFGLTGYDIPACKTTPSVDAELFRLRQLVDSYLKEDTELHRALAAKTSEMEAAVRRAEEVGYARGLEDAKRYPETLGLVRQEKAA
jgi:hypothetical protein